MSSWIPIVFALCWTTLLSCQGGVSPFGEQLPTPAELPPPQEAAQDLASSELELSRSSVPPSNAGVQDTHRPIGIESAGTGTCVWRPGGVMACVGLYESTLPPIDDVVDVWLRGGGCAIHSDRSATFWTSRYENGTLAMTMAPTKVKVAIAPHSVGIETGHAFFLSASRVYSWNLALPFEEASTMDARGARQIAFRIDEGYAVLADGSVGRWKNLGPFDETKRDFTGVEWSEMEPFDLHDVTRIFSGSRHFCALLADLSVECWGDNDLGQLGQGNTSQSSDTVLVPVTGIAQLEVNGHYACVRHTNGTVSCWGNVPWPTFARGSGDASEDIPKTLTPTPLPQIDSAVDLTLGPLDMCVTLADERVLCWGENHWGQLGVPPSPTFSLTPLRFPGIDDAIDIALGDAHACVIRKDGSVWCWGNNEEGTLGPETNWKAWATPRRLEGLESAQKLFLSRVSQSCALDTEEVVRCWAGGLASFPRGEARRVTFKEEDLEDEDLWTLELEQLDAFAVGLDFACAVKDGTAYYWQEDLSDNHIQERAGRVKLVSAGDEHLCALNSKNKVLCWGQQGDAQLTGKPPADADRGSTAELWVTGLEKEIVEMVSGSTHNCVRYKDGRVACWGDNSRGQLGLGHEREVIGAQLLPGVEDAVQLAASRFYSCALHKDGTVSCWGRFAENENNPLFALSAATPRRIEGLEHVAQVAVGGSFACARLEDGQATCWGDSSMGQLGLPNRNLVIELPWRAMLGE